MKLTRAQRIIIVVEAFLLVVYFIAPQPFSRLSPPLALGIAMGAVAAEVQMWYERKRDQAGAEK